MAERWGVGATAGRVVIISSFETAGQWSRAGNRTSISPRAPADVMTVRSLPCTRASQRARSRACAGRPGRRTTGVRPSAVARASVENTARMAASGVVIRRRYTRTRRARVPARRRDGRIDALVAAVCRPVTRQFASAARTSALVRLFPGFSSTCAHCTTPSASMRKYARFDRLCSSSSVP